MAMPVNGHLQPVDIRRESDGVAVSIITTAGIPRLAVDSLATVAASVTISPSSWTPAAPAQVTIGAASAALVAANATRKFLYLSCVTAGARFSLHLAGGAAVLDTGITQPTFNPAAFDAATGVPLGAVNGIASGAGTVIAIQDAS